MRNFNKLFLATLALLAGRAAQAQTGIGTTTPRTMLDVNGAISVAETTAAVSGNAATIPTGYSLVRLTGTATAAVTLTAASSPAPVAGQLLTINNTTTFAATLAGQTIAAGQSLSLVYSNSSWQGTAGGGNTATTASNGLTKTGNDVALGGALTGATTVAQGTNNLTFSGTANLTKLSGGATTPTAFTLGRTASDVFFSVAGVAGDFFAGTASGDAVLRTTTNNLILGTSSTGATILTTNNTERLRVTPTGNVGIGTSSPTQALTVAGGIGAISNNTISSQGAYLQWDKNGGGETYLLNQGGGGSAQGIRFGSVTTANVVTEYARFSANGYLGLGTTPSALLDVNGSTRLRGLTTAGLVTTDASGNLSSATAASLDATTASNGLTKTGNNTVLGGALTGATAISGITGTNTLTFSGTAPSLFTNSTTWIGSTSASTMDGATPDKVVMGTLSGVATIGAHNNALGAWSNLNIRANRIDITSNVGSTSGMRFTNLSSSSTPVLSGTAPLLVNSSGDVVVGPSGSSSVLTLGDVLTTSAPVPAAGTAWDVMRVNITVAGTYLINYSIRGYNGNLATGGGCVSFLHTLASSGTIANTQVMIGAGKVGDYKDGTGTGSIVYTATGAVTIRVGVSSVGSPGPAFTVLSDVNGLSFLTAVRLN